MDVVDLNENMDGPTNLVAWHQRLRCNSLIKMLQADGQPDHLIGALLQTQTRKFQSLVDKSITRMMIHTDSNLALLPYCLDKLRSHAKAMRRWRATLKFVNGLLKQQRETSLFSRFRKWANRHRIQRRDLHAAKYSTLVARADWDCIKLQRAANNVDDRLLAIDEFGEQKSVLFGSYMQS
jgi:hypothetical protein